MIERACIECRYITESEICPICGGKTTTKFEGYILIINPEKSEVAKIMGAKVKGKYAQHIKL